MFLEPHTAVRCGQLFEALNAADRQKVGNLSFTFRKSLNELSLLKSRKLEDVCIYKNRLKVYLKMIII